MQATRFLRSFWDGEYLVCAIPNFQAACLFLYVLYKWCKFYLYAILFYYTLFKNYYFHHLPNMAIFFLVGTKNNIELKDAQVVL